MNVTVLKMTDTEVDLSWMPPTMPNGVVEGYRVYFISAGNFTDVRSVPNPFSPSYRQDLQTRQQQEQRILEAFTVAGVRGDERQGDERTATTTRGVNKTAVDQRHEKSMRNQANSILATSEDGVLVYRLSDLSEFSHPSIFSSALVVGFA
jgi:hypothetical protein